MRKHFLKKLKLQLKINKYIIGVAVGSGLSAECVVKGGANFLLALSSGKFRQMGRGSLGGFLPYANSNAMVMDFGQKEILSLALKTPVLFGLNASDPTIDLQKYIDEIKVCGFAGINNFPSVGLFDGTFRQVLDDMELYQREVEAVRIANAKNMLTIAFVFDEFQAVEMLAAGADILCVHLGLTKGGILGAKKVLSLKNAIERVNQIFSISDKINPDVIKMIYGGPIKTPIDVQYMYKNTNIDGYIGGSAFERIPSEESLIKITKAFKIADTLNEDDLMAKMLDGITKHNNYVEFVKEYVAKNYMNEISFLDIAMVAHISRSRLSALFKQEVGCGFPEYLVNFRMKKAKSILKENKVKCVEAANMVGYSDYAQFSKMFKKYIGVSPKKLQRT